LAAAVFLLVLYLESPPAFVADTPSAAADGVRISIDGSVEFELKSGVVGFLGGE
jgi:hypothetical protein